MAYEKFKTIVDEVTYFKDYDQKNLNQITPEIRKSIYQRYLTKCAVFQRDNFTCQNKLCKTPESTITMHHIRFQKNGGKDNLKNCITTCNTCHKGFHRGKNALQFNSMLYQVDHAVRKIINWKAIKKENKKLRKQYKEEHGYRISWEMLCKLLNFLELEWELDEDDEE